MQCRLTTHINGTPQQGASFESFADDAIQVPWSSLELVHLRHATSEVLKALSGAAAGQGFIRAIQSDRKPETISIVIIIFIINIFMTDKRTWAKMSKVT